MAGTETIVLALGPLRETCQSVGLPNRLHFVSPSREDFVRV